MRTCPHCAGLTPSGDVCLHCDAAFPRRHGLAAAIVLTTGAVLLAACYGPPGHYREIPPDQGSAMQGSGAPGSAAALPMPAPAPATPHD